ncbi:Methionine aminopeptidase [Psidium guajava]|nr:Methionine aminopeptidase [Psidium guajava]
MARGAANILSLSTTIQSGKALTPSPSPTTSFTCSTPYMPLSTTSFTCSTPYMPLSTTSPAFNRFPPSTSTPTTTNPTGTIPSNLLLQSQLEGEGWSLRFFSTQD